MRRSIVALCAGLLGTSAVASCSKKADAPAANGKRGAGGKGVAFPVEAIKVTADPHTVDIQAPGVVDAFEHVQITARVSGVIDKVTFVEGQDVKIGQVMAYIDSRRYALSVSSAKAALEGASAAEADAQASLNRRQGASVSNPGVIAAEELETYQTKLRTAQASVDVSKEALKLAQLNLDDSNLKTPVAGTVQTRSVETGQYVQAGTVVATLLQRDPMLLHFNVTTSEAPRLKPAMPVEFTLKDSQNKYTGKITLVAGAADAESRLVPVTAQIDTQATHQFWLRPGSFAQVEVKLPSTRAFVMIPQTAARPSERGFLAYVVVGNVAHEHTLQLGLHTPEGMVEVKSGLNSGDMLVTRGVEALTDGAKVNVVTTMPAGTSDEVSDAGVAPAGSAALATGAAANAAADGAKPHKHRDGGAPPAPVAAGAP
ncbi:MAG: efflux RND transporter periplasmic adaptor subunit [Polyangiaceae bacterium]